MCLPPFNEMELQNFHQIGSGEGRLLGDGGREGRLRPHHHHQNHQALKCPRCDSLNTKFCYYNNYNLSQPRHFCKSCRRYWTKGGVLRNVPVGGGCRKTKRSKPKQTAVDEEATPTITTPSPPPAPPPQKQRRGRKSSNSRSSSESSSLTATNTKTVKTPVEAVSAHSSSTNDVLTSVVESNKLFDNVNMTCGLEAAGLMEQGSADCGIFSEIGSFTNLIASGNELSFGFNKFPSEQSLETEFDQQWQQQQLQGMMDDQQVELTGLQASGRSIMNVGFGGLDWQGNAADHGPFDLPTGAVDEGHWGRSHWHDQDHPGLYLP